MSYEPLPAVGKEQDREKDWSKPMQQFDVTYKAVCPKCGKHHKLTTRREAQDKIDAGAVQPPIKCDGCNAFVLPYRTIVTPAKP
jgi:hypothetical protein